MTRDDFKYIFKMSIAPIILIIIAIIGVSYALEHQGTSDELVFDNSLENILVDDSAFELDALAMSLTVGEWNLEKVFPETYKYVGGNILQSDNRKMGYNSITFDREILKKLLNEINFWFENEEDFGSKENFISEIEEAKTLTEEEVELMPDKEFEDGYNKFITREKYILCPTIKEKKFYDPKIIYIIETAYRKYIVTFDVSTSSDGKIKVNDYKVVIGT